MQVPGDVFRAYDIRGVAPRDLTPAFAEGLGRAVGTYVRRGGGGRIVVGRDCRHSGEALEGGLVRGLMAAGCSVLQLGVVPTPSCYWAIEHFGSDGGVQITGSHNPPEYNGFKLTLLGRSLHGEDLQRLRRLMETDDCLAGAGTREETFLIPAYVEALAQNLHRARRPLRVVVDAGNGTGGIAAVPLYEKLGFEVVPLFCDLDGAFPNHHPDPTVEGNLISLKRLVLERGADVGLAFDGDADRLGVIDDRGNVVRSDRLMILFSRAVLAEVPGATIIAEVKCSKTLYDDIAKNGGRGIMWKAGHSLIKAKMVEVNAALAGEMSGHIFFKHRYHGFDDAIYAGGRLLELLSESGGSMSDLLRDVPSTIATDEIRVPCAEEHKFEVARRVVERFEEGAAAGGYTVITIDGARVEWPDGWGVIRPSNTTPILVLRFEAQSDARLRALQALFAAEIERAKASLALVAFSPSS